MALETFTGWIKDLVATNPTGNDPKSQGDDHQRGVKFTLQNQFSGFTTEEAVEVTAGQINNAVGAGRAGIVFWHAGASAPAGALACAGQAVSRTDYPELFSAIGTAWDTSFGVVAPPADQFRLPPKQTGNGIAIFPMAVDSGDVGTGYEPVVGQHDHGMSHNHPSTATSDGTVHTHGIVFGSFNAGAGSTPVLTQGSGVNIASGASSPHTHNLDLPNLDQRTGIWGEANNNRPPAIGLLFCIWTGRA